eukprot:1141824-Pyramimonas_sp.AAC.1
MQEYISDETFAFIIDRHRLAKLLTEAAQHGTAPVARRITKGIAYTIEHPTRISPTKYLDQHYN